MTVKSTTKTLSNHKHIVHIMYAHLCIYHNDMKSPLIKLILNQFEQNQQDLLDGSNIICDLIPMNISCWAAFNSVSYMLNLT